MDESWSECRRRTESGIFFRTRVTPLGFSRSFFTRFALLQPTWCDKMVDGSGLKVNDSNAETLLRNSKCTGVCLDYFGAKTVLQLKLTKSLKLRGPHLYSAIEQRNIHTYGVHYNTHHYLVVDLNHFIASQDLHVDIRRRLQKERQHKYELLINKK